MAVSIDSVYQRVLALANKEQRGYITPLEFNLFANQAQLVIFDQYFYDLNQFKRVVGDETSFSDIPELIKNKLPNDVTYKIIPMLNVDGVVFGNYRTSTIGKDLNR